MFTFLAERVRENPLAYTTRGELSEPGARRFIQEEWEPQVHRVLPEKTKASLLLSPPDETGYQMPGDYDTDLYDLPMFTHPPLFVYALAVSRAAIGLNGGLLLPVACHLITIVMLAVLGNELAGAEVGITAAALVAVESVTWLAAERVWIDSLLQMLVTVTVAAAYWSAKHGGLWRFAVAGILLALAGLSKLIAGFVMPAIVVLWLQSERRPTRAEIGTFLLPPVLMIGSWLVLTKVVLGRFFPVGWPTAWMIDRFPWIRRMVERSPLVYVAGFVLVSPVLIFAALTALKLRANRKLWVPLVWCASFWLGMTTLGVMGMGFQMRHLAAGIPALCLLAAVGVRSSAPPYRALVFALAAYSWMIGITTALTPASVDPFPESLWRYVAELTGWNILNIPGTW